MDLGRKAGRGMEYMDLGKKAAGRGGIWIWILGMKAGGDINFGHDGRGKDFDQDSCLWAA